MFRGGKLRQRTVIDIDTAEKIGFVSDVEINEFDGSISALVVRKHGMLLKLGEVSIPWECISAVGNEFILVKRCDNS